MLNFSLIGAGRIGNMHAKIIKAHPKSNLKYVYDVNSKLGNVEQNQFDGRPHLGLPNYFKGMKL